eukprot:8781521-Pyramimonas_sp.AAC.1
MSPFAQKGFELPQLAAYSEVFCSHGGQTQGAASVISTPWNYIGCFVSIVASALRGVIMDSDMNGPGQVSITSASFSRVCFALDTEPQNCRRFGTSRTVGNSAQECYSCCASVLGSIRLVASISQNSAISNHIRPWARCAQEAGCADDAPAVYWMAASTL